jgi:hypothetical protein
MHNKTHLLIVTTLLMLAFFSCSKDDNSSNLTILPADNYLLRDTSNVINFTIKVESTNDLARYRITQTINNSTTTIKDELISGKNYIDWFDYTVPNSFQNYGRHEIKLIFTTIDVKGAEMNRAKLIYVDITDRTLAENSGNTMHSALSNQFNAYDLLANTPKYNTDSTAHIFDYTKPNVNDTLGRVWISPSGVKFVKLNGFDYANATASSVTNAYNSSVKNDTLRNLTDGDIVITKVGNTYMALKMVYVIDDAGNANDRYIFSVKK